MITDLEVFDFNWLDYFLLIICALTTWRGFCSGIFLGVVRLAIMLVSFACAVLYHKALAQWLAQEWGWADSLAQLLKPLVKLPEPFNSPEIITMPVNLLQRISAQIPLPAPWSEIINQLAQTGPQQTVGQAINLLLAQGLLKILAFLGIFFFVKWSLGFLASLVAALMSFSPLGPVDKLAGLALGFATGLVITLALITVLIPLQVPLAMLGADGLLGTLERGISGSTLINEFGPCLANLKIMPPLLPEFSSELLFKYINNGQGTEI